MFSNILNTNLVYTYNKYLSLTRTKMGYNIKKTYNIKIL